jgi:hypothetical protein
VQHLAPLRAVAPILFALLPVSAGPAVAQAPDRVRLQLMWYHQAQFAGIYDALHKGFYGRERRRDFWAAIVSPGRKARSGQALMIVR